MVKQKIYKQKDNRVTIITLITITFFHLIITPAILGMYKIETGGACYLMGLTTTLLIVLTVYYYDKDKEIVETEYFIK